MLNDETRTFHIGLHIEGTLKRHGNKLQGLLSKDGVDLSGAEVKAVLRKHKADHPNHEVYCPCGHVGDTGHCAGHLEASDS